MKMHVGLMENLVNYKKKTSSEQAGKMYLLDNNYHQVQSFDM